MVPQRRSVQKEAEMRASAKQLESFLKHGSEIVGLVDAASGIRYLSPSCERILGYDPDSLVGCNPVDYVHADDIPVLPGHIQKLPRSAGATSPTTHRIRDGGWGGRRRRARMCHCL